MSSTAVEGERQPLLPPAALVNDDQIPHHDEENPIVQQDASSEELPIKQKSSWFKLVWKTLLAILGILLLVLFIKGFIDADDVEVRNTALILFVYSYPSSLTLRRL